MPDFCRACSLEFFGEYGGDMDGVTSQENWARGEAGLRLCEGCGSIAVDPEGNCMWPCLREGYPGHGLEPQALMKLSRLLSQLPEQYRAAPNIGIFPERLGDHFRVTVRRHPTWDEFCWNREQRKRKNAWGFRPIGVEEVAFQVPLWEPGGLGRMRAWLRGTVGGYVATMQDMKATLARQSGSN